MGINYINYCIINYEIINNNTIKITELPVGYAIEDFKSHLEKLISDKNYVKDKTTSKEWMNWNNEKIIEKINWLAWTYWTYWTYSNIL